jgi:DNA-binding NarL/FixJ family response regulator
MSERAASSKSLASAHVVSLDAADDRSSKISEAGGLAEDPRFAPASRLSARKSHESDRAEIDNKRQLKSSKRRHLTAADLQKLLPSKNIASDLGISQRTVENHRASIMKKAGVRSLPALARLALAAAGTLMTDQSLATIS